MAESNFSLKVNGGENGTDIYHHGSSSTFFLSPALPFPQISTVRKKKQKQKKPPHNSELLFKDCKSLVFLVSINCNRMPEQVDHSLHPNSIHCYFKRGDICWRAERGSFQRNDESRLLDCSERAPHEWMRMWQKGWKGERKHFQTTNPLSFSMLFYPSHTLYICILCTSAFAPYISACCVNSFDF